MKRFLRFLEKECYYFVVFLDFIKGLFVYYQEISKSYVYKIPVIDLKVFPKQENKDKLFFILGGGPSVNKITLKNWELISKNCSLGINRWIVHPFEPNYLMIEGFRSEMVNSVEYLWDQKYMAKYAKNTKTIFLLKDIASSYRGWREFSKIEKKRVFIIPKFSIPGRTNNSRKRAFKIAGKSNLINSFPLFSRASVTLGISMGYMMGYRKIILCGIDMRDSNYFYEANDFLSHPLIPIPVFSKKKVNRSLHSTVDENINPVTADRSIIDFYEQILKPRGVKIYLGSENSLLYPSLPVFDWSDNEI